MGKLIADWEKAKVYENSDGSYTVKVRRAHNLDGFIEHTWDVEVFRADGIHSGGGYCTHSFPKKYPKDNKTLRERALEYARSYDRR